MMREKERNKHRILTGCHPPLLLFSKGSRLPNPWACLTIPLPPCRTPTLLFWSQGILAEKSLLTSNCYHLGLLLSFQGEKKKRKENNEPTCQSSACEAPKWILSDVCSDEVRETRRVTAAQHGAGAQTWARTHKCWLLITGRILFGSVVSVNIQWLVLQRSSSVDQMCHIARWERFCLSGNANKVWQTIGFAICPVLACHFHKPIYVTQWHLPCGKTGQVATLFWGFFPPPSSCHTYAENNVLLWPIQCNLWSCRLEQGYCGTLIACQLLRLQCV